jgi:hypothetical protein
VEAPLVIALGAVRRGGAAWRWALLPALPQLVPHKLPPLRVQ